jgi:membrane protein
MVKSAAVPERLRTVYLVLDEAYQAYSRKGDAMLGAAIAFYAMLSAAPLLVIAVWVAGLLFGQEEARAEVTHQVEQYLGPEAASFLWQLVQEAREPITGGLAATIGVGILLFGATRLFVNLQRTLNFVMGVRERRTRGIRTAARSVALKRLQSFVMVLACGILLMAMVIGRMVLGALMELVEPLAALPWFWRGVELGLSFVVFAVLMATIYKVVPDVYLAWRDVWFGGAVTALLLAVGILPIAWFLGRVSTTSAYGAAGTLVAILLFVYYAASIFFMGAEITAAWARRCGSGIRPRPYAVLVTEKAQEGDMP